MGPMPLAGDFQSLGAPSALYPLAIDVCGTCGLLQVRETIDPGILFNAGYSYASSTVPGLVRHFVRFAEAVAIPAGSPRKKLLEVGCNDGVFLERLREVGYDVVGIDASDNVAEVARQKGLNVQTGFFGPATVERLRETYGRFDVVTCSNVFAHDPRPNDFLEATLVALDPKGEFWVEVHSAHSLMDGLQWDCFYHEHCFYWTIHALQRTLARHGLGLVRYETTPMHGGALRAVFSREGPFIVPEAPELTSDDWHRFREASLRSKELIRAAVASLPLRYAYGAAGRAVTLINWTGIANELGFVVDGSPLRIGKAIPNTCIPVISESEFFARERGDWCFVTAHNYLEDIRRKVEAAFPDRFIKFVTPLPVVAVR